MGERGGSRSGWRLKQVALVVALVAAVGATEGDRSPDTGGAPAPSAAGGIPLAAGPTTVPLVAEPSVSPGPVAPSPSPSSFRSPSAVTMPPAAPVRLQIPTIGVDSVLMDLGLRADGTLEVPPEGFPAGWYTGAPTPGELGPAIIAGHVDWAGEPGVFFRLGELAPGDRITVSRGDGTTAQFRVTRVERFAKDEFPTGEVYGDLDHAGLRLITCGGAFDRQARSYEDNVVVFAELLGGGSSMTARRSGS